MKQAPRVRSAIPLALAVLALLGVLFGNGAARAAPKVPPAAAPAPSLPQLTIQFQVDPAEEPAYLCVITGLRPPASNEGPLGKPLPSVAMKDVVSMNGHAVWTEGDTRWVRLSGLVKKVPGWNDDLQGVVDAAKAREDATGKDRQERKCGALGERCFANLPVQSDSAYLICKPNLDPAARSGDAGARRIAVVDVDFFRDSDKSATIGDVSLKGTVAQITLLGADDGMQQVLSAMVRGGDYADVESGINVGGRVSLRLVPRCRVQDVEIPPADIEQGSTIEATLSIESTKFSSCTVTGLSGRRFAMALPIADPGRTKTLAVTVVPKNGGAANAEFRARWTGFEPPVVAKLRPSTVSFAWLRDCLYPGEPDGSVCPPAHVSGAGIQCAPLETKAFGAPRDGVCHYLCKPDEAKASEFDLPARVQFSHGADEVWQEELAFANQKIDGYRASGERYIEVDLSKWKQGGSLGPTTDVRAGRIRDIAVLDPAGHTHRVAPKDLQRIAVPDARCHEVLSYLVEGDRESEEQHVEIVDGRIQLRNPNEHVTWFTAGVAVGGGFSLAVGTAKAQVSQTYRMPFFRPYGLVRLDLDFRPPGWQFTFSPRTTFMFGPKDYFPIADPRKKVVESDSVLFDRFALELAVAYHYAGKTEEDSRRRSSRIGYLTFGASGGAVLEAPMSSDNFRRAGSLTAYPTAAVFVRPFLSRWVSVEILGRWLAEKTAYITTDLRGEATPRTITTNYLFGELSLRYGR